MKKRDKQKAPAPPQSNGMAIDAILAQLSSMKDNAESFLEPNPADPEGQEVWKADIAACEAATAILSALQDEGIRNPDEVRDLIHDYRAQAEQCRKMYQKYEEPTKPERIGGKFGYKKLCPECHREIIPRSDAPHCWYCGKRLDGR